MPWIIFETMKILSKPKKLRVILAMPVVQTRWTPLMKLRKMDHPQCKKKSKQKRSNFSKKITQKMRRLKSSQTSSHRRIKWCLSYAAWRKSWKISKSKLCIRHSALSQPPLPTIRVFKWIHSAPHLPRQDKAKAHAEERLNQKHLSVEYSPSLNNQVRISSSKMVSQMILRSLHLRGEREKSKNLKNKGRRLRI